MNISNRNFPRSTPAHFAVFDFAQAFRGVVFTAQPFPLLEENFKFLHSKVGSRGNT